MIVEVITENKGVLNMRDKPNGKIITQIPYRAQLEAERIDDTWSKVEYNNHVGYVMTKFLSSGKAITKSDLQEIYNSLKQTLDTIEKILK